MRGRGENWNTSASKITGISKTDSLLDWIDNWSPGLEFSWTVFSFYCLKGKEEKAARNPISPLVNLVFRIC